MEHISRDLVSELETRQIHNQESMLTLVQSLIREGKIEQAKGRASWFRCTDQWDEIVNLFRPATEPICEHGHVGRGQWVHSSGLTWGISCEQCTEEYNAKCSADREKWLKQQQEEHEKEEAFLSRPYRHQPAGETEELLLEIGVPSRFKVATVKRIDSTTDSMYLTGEKGTGKTHLAAAIVRELVLDKTPRHRRSVVDDIGWISVPDLLLEIRGAFRDHSERSEGDIIEQYSDYKLLVLDDLGAEKTTEWSLQTLYTIIDRRYREERQTIITSNLSLDELADKLDDRIASRLSELCRVVVLTGPDRRIQKKR